MATYKGVKGFTIQSLSADPPAPIEGQVWYNTTSGTMKASAAGDGAWASGTAVNTGRVAGVGQGTVTAALFEGGGNSVLTEEFDGSTWTEVGDLNTGRTENSGAGTNTAALYFGGNYPPGALNEEWNGTSWSEELVEEKYQGQDTKERQNYGMEPLGVKNQI